MKLDQFTKKYKLSKTLRFELRPVAGNRTDLLDKVITQDKVRAKDYEALKELIDSYHKYFIDLVLKEQTLFSVQEIEQFAGFYFKSNLEEKDKKAFTALQSEFRKKIAKCFTAHEKFKPLFEKELLHSKKNSIEKSLILSWLDELLADGKVSKQTYAEQCELIKKFGSFVTYLQGFHSNRKNMYSDEEQSTAIAYRVVHENLPRFLDNCSMPKKLAEQGFSMPEDINDFFDYGRFNRCLSQQGITDYNTQLGGRTLANGNKVQGLNELINLHRQKMGLTASVLPNLKPLYKQILSDQETRSFRLDHFESDEQMMLGVQAYNKKILEGDDENPPVIETLKTLIHEFMNGQYGFEAIYIKRSQLTKVSVSLFNEWYIIDNALKKYTEIIIPAGKATKKIEKEREQWLKKEYFDIEDVEKALSGYLPTLDDNLLQHRAKAEKNFLSNYFSNELEKPNENCFEKARYLKLFEEAKHAGSKAVRHELLKKVLDHYMELLHSLKPFSLAERDKTKLPSKKNEAFYGKLEPVYRELENVIPLYNKVRNFITKKPYSLDKFKVTFEKGSLLGGWDANKETECLGVLFVKEERYFLGILGKSSNGIFGYRIKPGDSKKVQERASALQKLVLAESGEDSYKKIVYKLLPGANKMLPKVFFSKSGIKQFNPPEHIIKINKEKRYTKEKGTANERNLLIDYYKEALLQHPEWKNFNFVFSDTGVYEDISGFYKEVEAQGYKMEFDRIKKSYVDEKLKNGELFLFEIYNKDFSNYSKGQPNLHTSYWKLLFSPENLKDVVLKLNGEAEIFYRPESLKIDQTVVHPANKPIANKNELNPKKESKFPYDIIKNRRFTQNKWLFHVPLTFNFKAGEARQFNKQVLNFLRDDLNQPQPDVHIIGLDRGERHLLYYTIINQQGEIKKQGSLNELISEYQKSAQNITKRTDYRALLDRKEKERDQARKSWETIENIKELKAGYLSHVIHVLAQMIIEYNAVVVMENLNIGFKRGRFKVEKQVYQKFEKALIDKLNYLVFKKNASGQSGHYLNAYQLTAPFETFSKLRSQTGFIFYVPAWYTSKIDPLTGFVNRFRWTYDTINKIQDFFSKFAGISYDCEANYFKFEFSYDAILTENKNSKKWIVCTQGGERAYYSPKEKQHKTENVTTALKALFDGFGIDYAAGADIRADIAKQTKKEFFEKLLWLFKLTVQLRYTYQLGGVQEDCIISPVCDSTGNFFDSRAVQGTAYPQNADANGAYHIALKGLLLLAYVKRSEPQNDPIKIPLIKNEEWFDFVESFHKAKTAADFVVAVQGN